MKAAKSAKIDDDDTLWLLEFHWEIFWDLIEFQSGSERKFFCKKCDRLVKYYFKDIHGTIRCSICGKSYSPTASTIFSNSKIYLPNWLYAIHILKGEDKNITLRTLMKILGVTNVTACNMRKKIRTINEHSVEYKLYEKYKKDILENFN